MSVHERGRKPTLTADPEALTKAPPVPSYFGQWARAEWRRIMPDLIARRILVRADLAGLENYCLAVGVVREIEATRQTAQAPIDPKLFGVQNRAAQTARQLAAEYGLSPTSRSRIGRAGTDEDDSPDPLSFR